MESNRQLGRKIPGKRLVTGGFGDIGYIAKRPGHGKKTEQRIKSYHKFEYDLIQSENERKAIQKDALINDYWRKFDMILVRKSAHRAVQLGMDQASRDLEDKRNKLKSILLGETSEYVSEYTKKAQDTKDKQMVANKLKAKDIMKRWDDSDLRRAQEVYTKMALEGSDMYKSKLEIERTKKVQEGNREIARWNHLQKLSDFDESAFWKAVEEQRTLKEKEHLEMEYAFKKDEVILERQSLRRQTEDRVRIKKSIACVEEIEDPERNKIRDAQFREWESRDEKSKRREALGFEALAQQIAENKVAAKKSQQEEMLVDQIMLGDNRKKMARELAAILDHKKQAWKELVLFRQSMVEYRDAGQLRNNENDGKLEEINKELELKKHKPRREKEYMRENLTTECFETNKRLASERIARDSAMKQKHLEEGAILEHYKNANSKCSDVHQKKKLVELNSDPYNDECVKYSKVLQERQRQEERDMIESKKIMEEEQQRNVMAALKRPVPGISEPHHPIYTILSSRTNI